MGTSEVLRNATIRCDLMTRKVKQVKSLIGCGSEGKVKVERTKVRNTTADIEERRNGCFCFVYLFIYLLNFIFIYPLLALFIQFYY